MKIFVSSPFDGGLFCLHRNSLVRYHTVHGSGICYKENSIFQVVDGAEVHQYSFSGKLQNRWVLGKFHYHDLFRWGTGFGIVNTDKSWVERYSNQFNLINTYQEIYRGASLVEDACHFNSARPYQNGIVGTAFTLGEESKEYRKDRGKGVIFIQNNEGVFPLLHGLQHPHSVRVTSTGFVLCDSLASELVFIGKDGQQQRRILVTDSQGRKGFTRGLCALQQGGWLVGMSANRQHDFDPSTYIDHALVVEITAKGEPLNYYDLPVYEIYGIVVV